MADTIVREWLADYKALSSSELHSFANTINENSELLQALFTIFEEKKYHQEFLDPVCHQLFSFYRSPEKELKEFALQYIPSLIGLYLYVVSRGERKNFRCVEVLLLGIYNLEVIDSLGRPIIQSFRIPSISKPSIYHEPISLSHSVLTEHALSKLEHGDNRSINIGPFPEVEKINATNRLQVMTILMRVYNQNVGSMSTYSHLALCKMCSKTVRQGYPRLNVGLRLPYGSDSSAYSHPRTGHRIPMSSPFLLELVHAVYFSMFNSLSSVGLQAMDDIHFRATQDLLNDVILVTNGIRNSLKVNPSGQPNDGPMGISVALSPTTNTTTVSKAIITNASFRTKKLPDDIPIQEGDASKDGRQLVSISEESDSSQQPKAGSGGKGRRRGSGANTSVSMNVTKLWKDKDKKAKKDKETVAMEMNSKSKEYDVTSNKPHSKIKGSNDVISVQCITFESPEYSEGNDDLAEMGNSSVKSGDSKESTHYEPENLGEAMSCISPITGYPIDSIGNIYVASNGHGIDKNSDDKYFLRSVDVKDIENGTIGQTPLQTVV